MSSWLPGDAGEDPTNAVVPHALTPAGEAVKGKKGIKLINKVVEAIKKEYKSWLDSQRLLPTNGEERRYLRDTFHSLDPATIYSRWLIQNGARANEREIAEDFATALDKLANKGQPLKKSYIDFVRTFGDESQNEAVNIALRLPHEVITNPEPPLRENPQPAVLPEGQSYWDRLPDEVVRHVIRPMLPKERSNASDPTKLAPTPGEDYRWLYQRVVDAMEDADEDYQQYLREYHEEHGEDEYPEENYMETHGISTTDVWNWIRDHPDDFAEDAADEIIAMFKNGEFELGDEDPEHYWDMVDYHDIRWLIENGTEDDRWRLYHVLHDLEDFPTSRSDDTDWEARWGNAYNDLMDSIDASSDEESSDEESSDEEEAAAPAPAVRLREEEAFLEPQALPEEPSGDSDPVGSGRPAYLGMFDLTRGGLVLDTMGRKRLFNH